MSPPVPPDLVTVAAGTHVLGSERRDDERPVREVRLSAFRAAPAPVTNAEYSLFVEATGHDPAPFVAEARFADPGLPVVGVSWHDAQAYLQWLSRETGLPLRLPTEAEREAAARGGLEGCDWPWGPEPPEARPELDVIASLHAPHVPGPQCRNPFGLSCTADNVHEWCADWYQPDAGERQPRVDPRGPESGTRRASRGGSWRHRVKFTRVAARSSLDPSFRYSDYGFRVFADV